MIKGNDLPGTELSNDAIDQALEWLARLRADTVGESELSDFTNWLTAADNHQQAWDYALDVWECLGVLSHMPLDDLLIDNPGSGRPQGLTYLLKMKWITSAWKSLAAVSATVAIVLTLLFASQPATQNYSAGLGEYRQVSLEDGSTIELNTNSQITVRLSQSSREVELVSGEAFFTVAPDKHSPFIVRVGDSKVQALGTAFNIYRQTQDQAAITVVEGVVRVSEGQGSALAAAETQLLLVDQAVTISASRGISEVSKANAERAIAWRTGQIIFEDASLTEAVKVLNRYMKQTIVLADKTASGHRVSGIFSSSGNRETLVAVAKAFDLEVSEQGNNWLLSQSKP